MPGYRDHTGWSLGLAAAVLWSAVVSVASPPNNLLGYFSLALNRPVLMGSSENLAFSLLPLYFSLH